MESAEEKTNEIENSSTICLEVYCTPCEGDKRQEIPEGYCYECKEYLCPTCIIYHKRFRMTKNHSIVSADRMPQAEALTDTPIEIEPPDEIETTDEIISQGKQSMTPRQKVPQEADPETQACIEHLDENLKYFCYSHEIFGCSACIILIHRACKIITIQELSKDYQKSKEYKKLVSDLGKMTKETESVRNKITGMKTDIETINDSALCDIEAVRRGIDEKLNVWENKLREKVADAHEKNKDTVKDLETTIDKIFEKVQEYKMNVFEYPTNAHQKLIAAKSNMTEVAVSKAELDELLQKESIKHYKIEIQGDLRKALDSMDSLGIVKFCDSEC